MTSPIETKVLTLEQRPSLNGATPMAEFALSKGMQPDMVGPAFARLIEAQTRGADLSNTATESRLKKEQDTEALRQEVYQTRTNGSLLTRYGELMGRAARLGLESYVRQQASEVLNTAWTQAASQDQVKGGVDARKAFLNDYDNNVLGELVGPIKLQYEQQQTRLFEDAVKKAKELSLTEDDWLPALKKIQELQGLDFDRYGSQIRAEIREQRKVVGKVEGGIDAAKTHLEEVVFKQMKARLEKYRVEGGNYTKVMTEIATMVRDGVGEALGKVGASVSGEIALDIQKRAVAIAREMVTLMYKEKVEEQKLIARINKEQFGANIEWMKSLLRFTKNNGPLLLMLAGGAAGAGMYLPLLGLGGIGAAGLGLREGYARVSGERAAKQAEKQERQFNRDSIRATLSNMQEVATQRGQEFKKAVAEMVYMSAEDRLKNLGIADPEKVLRPYREMGSRIRLSQVSFAPVPGTA